LDGVLDPPSQKGATLWGFSCDQILISSNVVAVTKMDVCQRCSPVADYFGYLFVVLTASSVEVQRQVISAGPASRILLKKCGYWM